MNRTLSAVLNAIEAFHTVEESKSYKFAGAFNTNQNAEKSLHDRFSCNETAMKSNQSEAEQTINRWLLSQCMNSLVFNTCLRELYKNSSPYIQRVCVLHLNRQRHYLPSCAASNGIQSFFISSCIYFVFCTPVTLLETIALCTPSVACMPYIDDLKKWNWFNVLLL